MLSDNLIKKLQNNPAFTEFTEYIKEKVEELDSLDGLAIMTNEQAGEEARVRSKAKTKLLEILSPVIDFAEKKEPTEEEINQAKKKAGL